MKKYEIQNEIELLFDKLSSKGKVETLASLYWELSCHEKDKFLRETYNN